MTSIRHLLRPDRQRYIERPFAWLPCRLLSDGFLSRLSTEGKLLYLVLALAADARGISFYSDERIQDILRIIPSALAKAQQELISQDLVAFNGKTYQLLSLPDLVQEKSLRQSEFPREIPKKSDHSHQDSIIPDEAILSLRQIFGKHLF
jgi:hypothetical protein